MNFNPNSKVESGELSFKIPGAGEIKVNSETRSFIVYLNWLFAQGMLPDLTPEVKEIGGQYQDLGLLRFLMRRSDSNMKDLENNLKQAIGNSPQFDDREERRLVREMDSFKRSPGSIHATAKSTRFIEINKFFNELNSESKSVNFNLNFKRN